MNDIADMAIRVNDFLSGMFAAIGIRLIDFKLEFGRVWDGDFARVILADEISPDGCRLWDIKTNQKLDKDRFRQDLGGVEEAYQEVARRLGLLQPERGDRSKAVLDPRQPLGKNGGSRKALSSRASAGSAVVPVHLDVDIASRVSTRPDLVELVAGRRA